MYAAYDDSTLRHLAVRPDRWGHGLASAAIETVLHAMDRRGSTVASLWCLEENHRARRFYERHGWRLDGTSRVVEFPPHPLDLGYSLHLT